MFHGVGPRCLVRLYEYRFHVQAVATFEDAAIDCRSFRLDAAQCHPALAARTNLRLGGHRLPNGPLVKLRYFAPLMVSVDRSCLPINRRQAILSISERTATQLADSIYGIPAILYAAPVRFEFVDKKWG